MKLSSIFILVYLISVLSFTTRATSISVTVSTPGTLKAEVEKQISYWWVDSLSISGPLNGDDMGFLRGIAGGRDILGNSSAGRLQMLDMLNTSIVSGGGPYYGSYITSDDVLGPHTFENCITLRDIILPNRLDSIASYAFKYCFLSSAIIPGGVKHIGDYAFLNCTLRRVTFSEGTLSIGVEAFMACQYLSEVSISSSVISIGTRAFSNCMHLAKLNVDANNPYYVSIDNVLYNKRVTELHQVTGGRAGSFVIPESVALIGEGALSGCSNLTSVVIPSGVIFIGQSAFSDCINLKEITIPVGVTSMEDGIFAGCINLESVNIPEGVVTIGVGTFWGCRALKSIQIPASVTKIDILAFSGAGLTTINVAGDNSNYSTWEGVLFNKDRSELLQYPGGRNDEYTIPDGVVSVNTCAFRFSKVLSVIFPGSVTS